jgi:N-methylhydantoinase A/oxoprolinase/acetone carboxylase beta subunit/N-methylhydantoinase B/oxoprolinase/acetone carboxylase alpha subunit
MDKAAGWEFWIDRGGTFTDVVAQAPDGSIHTHKLLSENPGQYDDAPLEAIRRLMDVPSGAPIPSQHIHSVKMGTTLATNALLERKGAPVGLLATKGFRDLLEIGYQERPDLFALNILKPESLAAAIAEVDERVLADGAVRQALDEAEVRGHLQSFKDQGIDSVAVLFLHSYAYPDHEQQAGQLAKEMGFAQVSLSHEVAREIKAVPRGDTTMVDAYLTPIMRDYVDRLRRELGDDVQLRFMQSNGGLVRAENFSGKDAILSGPAGGVVAYQHVIRDTLFNKAIGFDMGGTSTDVSRVDASPDMVYERTIAGVRIKAPMIEINTVAAGGGSILAFTDGRFTVGPESAGADPGPACYGRGGPATVTDANLVLGRIQPDYFPHCFGPNANAPLDADAARAALQAIAADVSRTTGKAFTAEEAAAGFIRIANENMVKPIKEISVARGYDVQEYALVCFGGAGAQHACAIATALGMKDIIIHPYAGVLSAYGMGLAGISHSAVEPVLKRLDDETLKSLEERFSQLENLGEAFLSQEDSPSNGIEQSRAVDLRYKGADGFITLGATMDCDSMFNGLSAGDIEEATRQFESNFEEWNKISARMDKTVSSRDEYLALSKKLREVGERLLEHPGPGETLLLLARQELKGEMQSAETLRRNFEEHHLQQFGYVKKVHPVEIVNLRVDSHGSPVSTEESAVSPELGEPRDYADKLDNVIDFAKSTERAVEHTCGVDESGPETDSYVEDSDDTELPPQPRGTEEPCEEIQIHFDFVDEDGARRLQAVSTPVCRHEDLRDEANIEGPALISDAASTIVVDPGWRCALDSSENLVLSRAETAAHERVATDRDPVMLEVFNNLFMSIAEQMGHKLERVAHSVNIKERLDFSCALFTAQGELVANAPHIPVHLGAMGESVSAVLKACGDGMAPGDVYVTNDPYGGGSHLPDVTVVTPVFSPEGDRIFFVANRGHHADIGGITPGSMPPFSKSIEEEGVVLHNIRCVAGGVFDEAGIRAALGAGPFPARNMSERLSDLQAQIAANTFGVQLITELCEKYTTEVVQVYMGHVRANAAETMAARIGQLPDGAHTFTDHLDDGAAITCTITVEGERATVDFTGTAPQLEGNLNAPRAVTVAAVLYCFRTLVGKAIPLNGGCLDPITLIIPEGTLLNPARPAAVVGGNVETSQRIVDTIYGALGVVAASQGTMNNLTFGTEDWGYYETICGGAGAGPDFDGASAVHTHMTNTRITDPEVLEHRYPVILREFAIRRGSGGQGKCCGGDGVTRTIEFREAMDLAMLSERRATAPYGLKGAAPAQPGQNKIHRGDGTTEDLPGHFATTVHPGDTLTIQTPGGGAGV